MGRTKKAIINSVVGTMTQIFTLVITFVMQLVFIKTLGAQYLGANGLFSNLLSFISFAELGIGAAITVALYKPLAEGDNDGLGALMGLYAKVYRTIGVSIIILGSVVSIWLPNFVKDESTIPNVRLMFLLFVISSAVTYFYAYARQLYLADQKSYKVVLNQFVFRFAQSVIQIAILIMYHNYFGYLITMIVCNFIANFVLHRTAEKEYPFLKNKSNIKLEASVISGIKKNVLGTVTSKIGWTLSFATDNILISKFLGLATVGVFSNYSLITQGLTGLVAQVTAGVTAGIGNLNVTENEEKKVGIYKKYAIVVSIVALVVSVLFMICVQDFIAFFFSAKYVLPELTVLLISINLGLNIIRQINLNFCSAMGLYWNLKYKSLIEAFINLFSSFLLVKYTNLGLNGVLIGTMVSHLSINLWWEPWIVFKYGFNRTDIMGLKITMQYSLLTIGLLLTAFYVGMINPTGDFIQFLMRAMGGLIGISITFVLVHLKSEVFFDFVNESINRMTKRKSGFEK